MKEEKTAGRVVLVESTEATKVAREERRKEVRNR